MAPTALDQVDGNPAQDLHALLLTNPKPPPEQLKDIIHNLYALMVQSYDYQGPNTADAMTAEM